MQVLAWQLHAVHDAWRAACTAACVCLHSRMCLPAQPGVSAAEVLTVAGHVDLKRE
jgi:hypothetical protein